MVYKILITIVLLLHLLWILFILYGFFFTLIGVFFKKELLKNFWLRTTHLIGIIFVATLTALDKYCPLTLVEIKLRQKINSDFNMDSFIIYYLEKLIYPEINPNFIIILTYIIAILSLVFYIILPPIKFYKKLGKTK